jgi:hypothetical protein
LLEVRDQPHGAFRYLTFGCRQTWVETLLAKGGSVPDSLGPKQLVALHCYLRDAGLVGDVGDVLSTTGQLLRLALESHSTATWKVIWTNWSLGSALFSWWATVPCGEYTRDRCLVLLADRLHVSTDRSIRDALAALVATLRQTPVGGALGQGLVVRSGRSWRILKTGSDLPVSWWALYSIAMLSPTTGAVISRDRFNHSRIAQVLGVDDRVVATALESLWQPDLCSISREGEDLVHLHLMPGVTPEIVLQRWIREEQGGS